MLLDQRIPWSAYRIEAEVAIGSGEGYVGCIVGVRDVDNYDVVYVYPDSEGRPGWIQYDPCMCGSMTWQIYHGPRYQSDHAPVPPGDWVRLCVDVRPGILAVGVGTLQPPMLVISPVQTLDLGRIGLWGYLETYARSLRVTPLGGAVEQLPDPVPVRREGVLRWLVSRPAPSVRRTPPPLPDASWQVTEAEENGTVNVTRLYPPYSRVYLQADVLSPTDCSALARLRFSDRAELWLNGDLLYEGTWLWNWPRSDGRIRRDHATCPARLRCGHNRLVVALDAEEPAFRLGYESCGASGHHAVVFVLTSMWTFADDQVAAGIAGFSVGGASGSTGPEPIVNHGEGGGGDRLEAY